MSRHSSVQFSSIRLLFRDQIFEMSQLLRRVLLKPSSQPRRWGGHAVEHGPLNPKPGEQWIPHPNPQQDWYKLAAFICVPTGLYYFCANVRDTSIGKSIIEYRRKQLEARRQRQWQAHKDVMYREYAKVMARIEGKKIPGRQKDVPDYKDVFSKPVGVAVRDVERASKIEF